jgi:hypothetical protein
LTIEKIQVSGKNSNTTFESAYLQACAEQYTIHSGFCFTHDSQSKDCVSVNVRWLADKVFMRPMFPTDLPEKGRRFNLPDSMLKWES